MKKIIKFCKYVGAKIKQHGSKHLFSRIDSDVTPSETSRQITGAPQLFVTGPYGATGTRVHAPLPALPSTQQVNANPLLQCTELTEET